MFKFNAIIYNNLTKEKRSVIIDDLYVDISDPYLEMDVLAEAEKLIGPDEVILDIYCLEE